MSYAHVIEAVPEVLKWVHQCVTVSEWACFRSDHSAVTFTLIPCCLGCVAGGTVLATAIKASDTINGDLPRGTKHIHVLSELSIGQLKIVPLVTVEVAT